MRTILLATDLDSTLVKDDDSLLKLNVVLKKLVEEQKIKLVYATGRSLELVSRLQKDEEVLPPDALIAAVGSEIYLNGSEKILEWPSVKTWPAGLIKRVLSELPYLIEQPASEQRPYKISYYMPDKHELLASVRQKLSDLPVDVVYSSSKYLDILPKGINKGSAIEYLAELWDIKDEDIIVCGDSANDISMMQKNKSIIVGHAHQELLDWARTATGTDLYVATAKYAAGILEGLYHFGVIK